MSVEDSIDAKLDRLRAEGADLVSAITGDSKIVIGGSSAPGSTRVSESKARYVPWDLPMLGAQRAQPAMWSDAIPRNREFLDSSAWKSEMTRAQDEALIAANTDEIAGSAPVQKELAPIFFAWDTTSVDSVPAGSMETTWIRAGDGWKTNDGLFYSDKDLVKDILTDIKEGVEDQYEEEEEEDEDMEGSEEYVTENQLNFKWNDKPDMAPSCHHPDNGKGALGFSEEKDGVGNWCTEYDTQCLLSMALSGDDEALGPVAGLKYNQPPAAPVMFSWGRDKPKKKKHDNEAVEETEVPVPEVFASAPFDTSVPVRESWTSEANTNYTEDALRGDIEGTAALPARPVGTPFGTAEPPGEPWQSEAQSEFTEEALLAEAPVDIEHEDDEDTALKAGTGKPIKKRFLTETSLSFKWPHGAVKPELAHEQHKSQIIYTNEESAAVLPPPAPVSDPDNDIISMKVSIPKISETAERFRNLNLGAWLTSEHPTHKHKNDSDPYLLAHHDTTLEKVMEEALNEVSMDASKEEGAEVDKSSQDKANAAEEEDEVPAPAKKPSAAIKEEKKEIIATPAEAEALMALLAPASNNSDVVTAEARQILQKITEYNPAPLPPSLTVKPQDPVVKKEQKAAVRAPSYIAKRGTIINKGLSKQAKAKEAAIAARKANRAARDSTRKNANKATYGGNPVLKNPRYPTRDHSVWRTEAKAQFQYVYVPPPKLLKRD